MAVAIDWVQTHCVIPDGFRKGDPFELYDFQLRYLANYYLVRGDVEQDLTRPILAPAFVNRRGVLIDPQKKGKNPLIASQVCLEGVGPALFAGWAADDDGYVCADHGCSCGWEYAYDPGEPMGMLWPTALVQITAFSEESTDNTYDALRPMIDEGPLHDLIPKTGEEFIRLPNGGRIDTVTSSAQSRLGQRVTFVPQDEVGIWTPFNKMTKVADTQWRGLAGMGGRASLTSNAWDPTERSVAQQEMTSGDADIYRQMTAAPKSLSFTNKRERRRIFRIVYEDDTLREKGGHVDLDSIEAECASLMKRDLAQAMRFFGNIVQASGGTAIDPKRWEYATDAGRIVTDGERIGVGFDGSISDDCTALIGCTADGHVFVPEFNGTPTIWTRPEHAPDGWRVPRLEVKRAVRWIFETYDVGRFYGDPPKWSDTIETWMEVYNAGREVEDSIVMFFDTNQPKRMSGACDRFTTGLVEDEEPFSHDGSSLLTDHVLAMVRKKAYARNEDPDDRRVRFVFTKGDDGRKIDAGIGAVLAYEAAMSMPDAAPALEPFFEWS